MALAYAKHYPDAVSHLVLLASSPITGEALYKEADRYFEESVCPERKALFSSTYPAFHASKDHSFRARMSAFGPKIWYNPTFDATPLWKDVLVDEGAANIIFGPMFADYDVFCAAQAIQCPVFLGLGRYDYFNPPHLWESYRNAFSALTVRVFEQSRHTPQLEESALFDNELLAWISS